MFIRQFSPGDQVTREDNACGGLDLLSLLPMTSVVLIPSHVFVVLLMSAECKSGFLMRRSSLLKRFCCLSCRVWNLEPEHEVEPLGVVWLKTRVLAPLSLKNS